MIQLDQYEKQWILVCKGHLKDKYPYNKNWIKTLKPLFKDIYGWDPEDNDYDSYLRGLFDKLLDLYLKIKDNHSDPNYQLKTIFYASFDKRFNADFKLPIERAINEICSLIRITSIVDKDGNERFDLTL